MIRTADGNGLEVKAAAGFSGTCGALLILAKPGIVAAVTLSGFTGMVVAQRGLPPLETALPCGAGLLLMAAGSAIINSVLDRRMDEQMERLTVRSAALRRVGSCKAMVTAFAVISAAIALASATLNARTTLLLVAAALSYTLYYTLFLKRHTHWAALLGGLPGAFPVLIGHAAIQPHPGWASLALFLIMLIWQPPHFWLLSLSHRDEYRAAGVPVLPLVKGERFTRNCIYLGVVALIPATILLHIAGPCSTGYAAAASLSGCAYLIACRQSMAGRANYRVAFRYSIVYLLLLFTIIIADLTL